MYTILTISVSFLKAGGHKCMNQDQVSIKRDQLGINLQFVPSVSITQPGLGLGCAVSWAEPALFITGIFLHHGNNWDNVTLYCHPALQLSIISSYNRKYKLTIMIKVELKLSFNPQKN